VVKCIVCGSEITTENLSYTRRRVCSSECFNLFEWMSHKVDTNKMYYEEGVVGKNAAYWKQEVEKAKKDWEEYLKGRSELVRRW